MTPNEYIQLICQHITQGDMSFIVGAGFSKNISEKFMTWNELLADMAYDMYPEPKYTPIGTVINGHGGYLAVAEDYVQRHGGFHEAIDNYIEERTPYIENGKLFLNGKELPEKPDFECHEQLRMLDIPSIYTFNYDNCLESVLGASNTTVVKRKIEDLKEKGRIIANLCALCKSRLDSIHQNAIDRNTTVEVTAALELNDGAIENAIQDVNDRCAADFVTPKNYKELNQLCARSKMLLSRIKNQIDSLENGEDRYLVVKNGFDISLTNNRKSIYKLHGDIRIKDNGIEFDGDKHCQYIISQSDYSTYSEKHEPFVNLMKVSLLKGHFCLIGFGFNDPNFRIWINWTKDVLDNAPIGDEPKPKIFFIHVGDKALPAEQQLVLRNHYVHIVNLFDVYKDAKSRKERLKLFLADINNNEESFHNLLRDVVSSSYKKDFKVENHKNQIIRLWNMADSIRIPDLHDGFQSSLGILYSKVISTEDKDLTDLHAKLFYVLLRVMFRPLQYCRKAIDRVMNSSAVSNEVKLKIKKLQEDTGVIFTSEPYAKPAGTDEYIAIINELFHFHFSVAEKLLDAWRPIDMYDKTRYLMLRSFFGKLLPEDDKTLKDCLRGDGYENVQDFVFAIDMLRSLKWSLSGYSQDDVRSTNKRLNEQIGKHLNVSRYFDIRRALMDALGKESHEIKEYDDIVHINYGDGGRSRRVIAEHYILMLVQLGLPLAATHTRYINIEEWNTICSIIFPLAPYACLFYSLQGNDSNNKLIRKVAYDYMFYADTRKLLPTLLPALLDTLKDDHTPADMKSSIAYCASMWFKAVESKSWGTKLQEIFDGYNFKDFDCLESSLKRCLINGIKYVDDIEFKNHCMARCLENFPLNDFQNRIMIAASHCLAKGNIHEGVFDKLAALSDSAQDINDYYVLLNLREGIPSNLLEKTFLSIPEKFYNDVPLIEGIAQLAQELDSSSLTDKVNDVLHTANNLWHTGITEEGYVVMEGVGIHLNYIQQWIKLSDEVIINAYHKLITSLEATETFLKKQNMRFIIDDFDGSYELLLHMRQYLYVNCSVLKGQPDYQDVCQRVIEALDNFFDGQSRLEILTLDNEVMINRTIDRLKTEIIIQGAEYFHTELALITSRIVLNVDTFLESFITLMFWVLRNSHDMTKERFQPLYTSVLTHFEAYFKDNNPKLWNLSARKDAVEYTMMLINKEIDNKWNVSNEFWDIHKAIYKV